RMATVSVPSGIATAAVCEPLRTVIGDSVSAYTCGTLGDGPDVGSRAPAVAPGTRGSATCRLDNRGRSHRATDATAMSDAAMASSGPGRGLRIHSKTPRFCDGVDSPRDAWVARRRIVSTLTRCSGVDR